MAQSTPTPQAVKTQIARQTTGAAHATGSANVVHLWVLNTTHTRAQVEAAGYFNTVQNRLTKGALIFATMGQGGTLVQEIYQVTSVGTASTDVVVAPLASVRGAAGGYKLARGVATITGSGTVVTGLATVVSIVATLAADASLTNGIAVTASIGDQAGAPAAGSVNIKVWKSTGSGDVTPIASTAAVGVNWIAVGT